MIFVCDRERLRKSISYINKNNTQIEFKPLYGYFLILHGITVQRKSTYSHIIVHFWHFLASCYWNLILSNTLKYFSFELNQQNKAHQVSFLQGITSLWKSENLRKFNTLLQIHICKSCSCLQWSIQPWSQTSKCDLNFTTMFTPWL